MPAPTYIGDTNWRIQAGAVSGMTDDGLVWYEIPYAGAMRDATAFRRGWRQHDNCPIPGFGGLGLVAAPEIREDGPRGSATLRFEGPNDSGDFEPPEDTEEYFHERHQVTIKQGGDTFVYDYDAPVAIFSYTIDFRRAAAKNAGGLEDPELMVLVDATDETQIISAAQMNFFKGEYWRVVAASGFANVVRNPSGTYTHREYHTKLIEPKNQ